MSSSFTSFGLAFGGTRGLAISGFGNGFFATFCGKISAVRSGAFAEGFKTGSSAFGFALGGDGGGGGTGFFVRATFCFNFAVLGLYPCLSFVIGTDCTISKTTIGCSSGRSRFIEGKPIHASMATPT